MEPATPPADRAEQQAALRRAEAEAAALRAQLARLEASRLLRWTEPLRRPYAAVRRVCGAATPEEQVPPGRPEPAPAPSALTSELLPHPDPYALLATLAPVALTRAGDHPPLLFRTDDAYIGRALFEQGSFDHREMATAFEVVGTRTGRQGRVFVDVGANIGSTTINALTWGGYARAVCFEPDEENARLLRCNLVLNGLEGRAVVHQVGVSSRAGEMLLELSQDNRGDHRLRQASQPPAEGAFGEEARPVRRVHVVTLDAALAAEGLEPEDVGVVWVDTQGHEGHVLDGATAHVDAGVPFVVEHWPYGLRRYGTLEHVEAYVSQRFGSLVDLREHEPVVRPASAVREVTARLAGTEHTDLVLLP